MQYIQWQLKYIFISRCSIYSMTIEVYLLQQWPYWQGNGFLTTGLLGANDGHYKVLTMSIISTL